MSTWLRASVILFPVCFAGCGGQDPRLTAVVKELGDSRAEVAKLKAEQLDTNEQLRLAKAETQRIKDEDVKIAQRALSALKKQEQDRDDAVKAHIERLPAADRDTTIRLLEKVKSNTITVQEFHVLQGFLGGDLAFYVLPGLRNAYYSAIRRLAKEDPSSAKMLRTTDPDAFAEDK